MIDILFNTIEVAVAPISGIHVDIVAMLYDLLLACVTGYIVWFKTDEYMQRRDERHSFYREQQEYSRYLGRINLRIKSYRHDDEISRLEIEDLLENEPIRNTFVFQGKPEQGIFTSLDIFFAQIQGCINESEPGQRAQLLRISREISKCRLELLGLRINQPPMRIWNLWGKPALALNS